MRLAAVWGTRPEIIKMSPVVEALRAHGHDVEVVATGQHHDPGLTDAFYRELAVEPDVVWTLPTDEAERVGALLTAAYRYLAAARPDAVLVQGDTYTVPLFALAARRHHVPVIHLEAGLRSFNDTSIEEVNRRIAATTASLHLAPTELAARFLRLEGVPDERIRVVGNPVVDVLRSRGPAPVPVERRGGIVMTAHRPTNVDDPDRLDRLVAIATSLAASDTVTFPMHPRTRARLVAAGWLARLADAGVAVTDPVPYSRMLELVSHASVVVTDSGGIQEEAAWYGVPVVVLRRSTPRWESVHAGISALVGLDVDACLAAVTAFSAPAEQSRVAAASCPYGDGHTAERVARLLADPDTAGLLTITEPEAVPA
jgi:UDP-N-acetylglucosamine 2-epimerase (non-hydrolysing)